MYKKSLAYPHLVWMLVFVIVPIVLIFLYSVNVFTTNGTTGFSLENYKNFFDVIYMKIFAYSLWIALLSTVFCLGFGYPVAYILAKREKERLAKGKKSSTMFMLFVMPMWMNMMLRTYSWLTILESNGLLNTILGFFGLPEINILYTTSAVVLGMVYDFIPFMILPLYSVLVKIDNSIKEAAEDLGASPFKVFFKVTLPLSLPGVVSGITMVFLPSITTFYISNIFGGGQIMLIGNLIEQQFLVANNWNFGSAISIVMMILVFLSMKIMNLFNKGNQQMAVF
ncbi:MAG: ABC transporter permease [Clostridia bacterium]|nr:ABC transporter permease [Clostridia bacterium]